MKLLRSTLFLLQGVRLLAPFTLLSFGQCSSVKYRLAWLIALGTIEERRPTSPLAPYEFYSSFAICSAWLSLVVAQCYRSRLTCHIWLFADNIVIGVLNRPRSALPWPMTVMLNLLGQWLLSFSTCDWAPQGWHSLTTVHPTSVKVSWVGPIFMGLYSTVDLALTFDYSPLCT